MRSTNRPGSVSRWRRNGSTSPAGIAAGVQIDVVPYGNESARHCRCSRRRWRQAGLSLSGRPSDELKHTTRTKIHMRMQRQLKEYQRKGDTAKCPACGVSMDAEAYRCPRCRIYFCFKCRRRVQTRDQQFQCLNQQCRYHGKLLCNACVVDEPNLQVRSRKRYRPMVAPGVVAEVALGVFVVVLIAGLFITYWWTALLAAVVLATAAAAGLGSFATHDEVTERVRVGYHQCCIACRRPAERLRG